MNRSPADPDLERSLRIQALADARRSGRTLAHQLKKRQLSIRRSSIWRDHDSANSPAPTVPYLLQGSGSSGTPLKLYLLLLWIAGSPGGGDPRREAHLDRLRGPHTALLDLELIRDVLLMTNFELRASNSDYRRLVAALRRLRDERLIDLSSDERSIRLLSEDRRGRPYSDPGVAHKAERADVDLYITLPVEFFTCGWFSALSPHAVLALLVHRWHWIEGRQGHRAFNGETLSKYVGVSKATIRRGEQLLTHWEVLQRTNRIFVGRGYGSRHEFRLDMDRLKRDCPDTIPPPLR